MIICLLFERLAYTRAGNDRIKASICQRVQIQRLFILLYFALTLIKEKNGNICRKLRNENKVKLCIRFSRANISNANVFRLVFLM